MTTNTNNLKSVPEKSPRQARYLWYNLDYMLMWSGQAISAIGMQAAQLAFPLLILTLTGSPAQAGFVGALRTLSYLIFSLPAGSAH